jgi:hypothetical protein
MNTGSRRRRRDDEIIVFVDHRWNPDMQVGELAEAA